MKADVNVKLQRGFVLVSTIWLTLIMFVLAGFLSVYANSQLEAALVSNARIKDNMDRLSLEQTLLFLLSTRKANRDGYLVSDSLVEDEDEIIRLDGTLYIGPGETFYAVNDSSGLIGVNAANSYHLINLLIEMESSGLRREALVNALQDYIDDDNRPRINGKEAPAYRVEKLREPANEYLSTVEEIHFVFGWRDWLDSNSEFNLNWLSTNWRSRININAVPEALLTRLLPIGLEEQELLIQRRKVKPFKSVSDLYEVLDLRANLDDDYFTFLPSQEIRIQIFSAHSSAVTTMLVRFTPQSVQEPWVVNHRYQLEHREDFSRAVGAVAGKYFDR